MAKLWVTNASDKTRVPFLRGILTRTLTDTGLSFDVAYEISSKIRDSLDDESSISTEELQRYVSAYLTEHYGETVCRAYNLPDPVLAPLMVLDANKKQSTPFYRAQHIRCLESCGLSQEQAVEATNDVLNKIQELELLEVKESELGRLTYDYLKLMFGNKVAHRYLVWIEHIHSGRPLILLIGGTTGSGKSTIATEVAHRMGIVRTQSMDMLREVMRTILPQRLLPVLHVASFNAGDSLPEEASKEDEYETRVTRGYMIQSELLSVPSEAVIQRALRERVSLILEGVQIHPSMLDRIDTGSDAVVVMVVLAILKPKELKGRLSERLLEAPKRSGKAHLSHFDKIWQMQSFILSEADRMSVTILPNDDKERVTNRVMKTVIDQLAQNFASTPEQVFPSDLRFDSSNMRNPDLGERQA